MRVLEVAADVEGRPQRESKNTRLLTRSRDLLLSLTRFRFDEAAPLRTVIGG
jgi:hypothetical protein